MSDDTEGAKRRITLFDGAALFDVANDGRSFAVKAGDLTIEVLGTTFEASRFDDITAIYVSEGSVRVTTPERDWTLGAGEKLLWSAQTVGRLTAIEPEEVALWRDDRFVADGLSFGQLVDVIDRRLPGRIMSPQASLAEARVSGISSLKNPLAALRAAAAAAAAAAARDARVVSVGQLGYIILP